MASIDDEYGISLKSSCIFRQIRAFFWKPAPGTNSGTYLRIGITSTKNAPKLAAAEILLAAASASSIKGSSVCCIWRPYANDKAMPPMALSSSQWWISKTQTQKINLLPWYTQTFTWFIEETRQHFADEFHLYGLIELRICGMEMLLKDASAFSPRFPVHHSWHEPSPAHPVWVHSNEKGWFLWNRSYVAYNSQSIGNTGLQKKIEILHLSRRLGIETHRLE